MNKQQKLWLGLGLVAVGGYWLWKKSNPATTTASWDAVTNPKAIGKRVQMSGKPFQSADGKAPFKSANGKAPFKTFAENLPPKDSGWVRADGVLGSGKTTDATQGKFYDIKDSGWVKG